MGLLALTERAAKMASKIVITERRRNGRRKFDREPISPYAYLFVGVISGFGLAVVLGLFCRL